MRDILHSIGARTLERILNTRAAEALQHWHETSCPAGHCYQVLHRAKQVRTILGTVHLERMYLYDSFCRQGWSPIDTAWDIERTSFSPGLRRMMMRIGAQEPFALAAADLAELAGIHVEAKQIERLCHAFSGGIEAYAQSHDDATSTDRALPDALPMRTAKLVRTAKLGRSASEGQTLLERQDGIVPHTAYICMDGTGVPVVPRDVAGHPGKQGEAKTREVKLGCVFTQTTVDEKGSPVREPMSTSYVGAIEPAHLFGERIARECSGRGLSRADRVCVIGDGAAWIWNLAADQFPYATQILDLYHAHEHYWSIARLVFAERPTILHKWTAQRKKELEQGAIGKVIAALHRLGCPTKEMELLRNTEIAFFQKNRKRMRYAQFRYQGLFVGSGVIEAGCKTVIGRRLKQAGMHWTVDGANSVIGLRCLLLSGRWEDLWEWRAAA